MDILVLLGVLAFISWIFYSWGASIAEKKGLSRSLGWWSALLGLIGIVVILTMASDQRPSTATALEGIEKLADLRDRGALTEQEFNDSKAKLLESLAKPEPKPVRKQIVRKRAFCRDCDYPVTMEDDHCPNCGRVFQPVS